MRIDKDIYATVADFFLEDEEGVKALDPEILLQQIEERLVTMDQAEQKRLRFELAMQTVEENVWSYKNRLQLHYREAHVQKEAEFVEVYQKGVYNKELRKLLMLHEPPLTSIEDLKAATQHYQTQLIIYADITPDVEPSAIAGLGGMHYG